MVTQVSVLTCIQKNRQFDLFNVIVYIVNNLKSDFLFFSLYTCATRSETKDNTAKKKRKKRKIDIPGKIKDGRKKSM